MQVVEYLEEGILGAGLVGKLVHIVYDQYVHRLVVVLEVGYGVLDDRVHVVGLESVCSHVKHYLVGELLLDLYADGLGKVGLSESRTAIYKKGLYAVLPGFSAIAMPAARPRRLQSPSMRLSKE